MIVIYYHYDSAQYYKTVILANFLALARSVSYKLKVHCKLKRTLRSIFTIVKLL
jgi:hypothetical protein